MNGDRSEGAGRIAGVVLVLAMLAVAAVAMPILEPGNENVGTNNQTPGVVETREQVTEEQQALVPTQTQGQLQGEEQPNPAVVSGAAGLEEQLQEQASLNQGDQGILSGIRNLSAFVQVFLNDSYSGSLLGEGPEGIGPRFSDYARDLNASLRIQIQAEERIESRNPIIRFFLGGDREAARILEQEAVMNRDRIQEMQQLLLRCGNCDPQVQTILQNQLQQMDEEQSRLQQLAQREQQDTGLFGWIWR